MRRVTTAGLLTFAMACTSESAIAPTPGDAEVHAYTSPGLIYSIVVDTVIDLDPTGPSSEAVDLNESGWIVGTRGSGSSARSTLWKGSASQRLQLPQPNGVLHSDALGINDNGAVVGTYADNASKGSWMWTSTSGLSLIPESLFTFYNGDAVHTVLARDINNLGTIVGTVKNIGGTWAAAFRKGTLATEVMSSCGGGDSWGFTINDADWIAGVSDKYSPSTGQAFVKTGSSCNQDSHWSEILRLNNNGVAVGRQFLNGVGHRAMRWSQSMGYTTLAAPGDARESVAYGVNNSGIVVGAVGNTAHEEPFVYHSKTGIVLLPDRRASTCWRYIPRRGNARAINDANWIVGVSEDCLGKRHATLWKIRVVTTDPTSTTP